MVKVADAVEVLKCGGLVAFPTETVYGLGADAANPAALTRVFAAKGRPSDHPLIVHLAAVTQLDHWAQDIPLVARDLAARFWPGPLTLILKRTAQVPDAVTGGQDTVGLRVPSHPVARALLTAFGGGIAAPSANRFGRVSPTTAAHVAEELGDAVDLILDGGKSQVGLESTILDLSIVTADGKGARVLRPGGVSVAELAAVLRYMPVVRRKTELRVSGSLPQHYAPVTPARLVTYADTSLANIGVIARCEKPGGSSAEWRNLGEDPGNYGQGLYAALRELDSLKLDVILIEAVPDTPPWLAVRDRIERATSNPSR